MNRYIVAFVVVISMSHAAFAIEDKSNSIKRHPNGSSVDLTADAAKVVGNLLRDAKNNGNKAVHFQGGPQVTIYSVGNLSCYFQNADDSVSCSSVQ